MDINIELEFLCHSCWGKGYHLDLSLITDVECPDCKGLGYIPTELGKDILKLVTRHMPKSKQDTQAQ